MAQLRGDPVVLASAVGVPSGARRSPPPRLEHLAFFTGAILFWWPVVNPAPHVARSAHPVLRVVYLVTGALQSAALGLLLAASPSVLYPSYAASPEPGGLSPLDDQALGGVVMWGWGGAVDMLAVILLLHQFFTVDAAR